MSMSLLSRASLLLSLPSSQLGCLFQQGPSNGHWSMSLPSSALCVTGHHKTRKSLRWTSEQDQQPLFQLLRKQGSVMTVKINLEVWGFFIWWWFFCLSLVFFKVFIVFQQRHSFKSAQTTCGQSQLPLRYSYLTSWAHVLLILWKLSCENCLVYTRSTPGNKFSFLLVSLPSLL